MKTRCFVAALVWLFPLVVSATEIGAVTCSPIATQGSASYNVNVQCSVQVTEGVQGAWFNAYLQDCNNFCASIGRSSSPSPDGFRCTSGENRPWSAIQAGVDYGPTGCWHNCALPEGFAGAASNGYWCYHPSQKRDNDHTDKTLGCYCAKSDAAPQAQLGINKNPASATKLTGVNAVPANWQSVSVLASNDRPDRIFNLLGVAGYGRSTSFNMTINVKGACGTSAPFTAVLGRADGTYQNRTFFITLPACPPTPACSDGLDNDGDGAIDMGDFSCSSPTDTDERNPRSQCQDGLDNDSDGLVDMSDPACTSNQGNNEGGATSQCQDGIDNDGDGATDFPNDFSCSSATDNNEGDPKSQCQDGIDNDGDGAVDFPADFSCQSAQDNDELSPKSQCQDGVDNDADGLVDLNDPGCSNGQDNAEGDETARLAVGVECVMNNTDGTKTAYFSYNNVTAQALSVPVGSSGALVNSFSPGLPDQGQPTSFVPGVVKGVVAVPLSTGGVTWTIRASGSAVSTATASAASPQCGSVQPLIECQGYDAGQLRAQSGYVNPNPFDVKLNLGSLNFFSPGSIDQGQPIVFKSGLNRGSFGVVLVNPATPLVWELNGQKVSASNSLSVCTGECIDTAVGEIRGELDDIAVQIAQLTIDAAELLASADSAGASAASGKKRRRRNQATVARDRADAERAEAKAQSYVTQSKALTIQFPDVVKNCPEAPQYCETVDRGPVIAQLRALYAEARNTAQRTMARAYFRQTGSTNRRDALVRKAKQLEAQGAAELDKLPRTETVCK